VNPLTGQTLLDAWEEACAAEPAARPLVLLSAAEPGRSWDALAAEPLGRRDARLGTLREAMAGAMLDATTACPECGEVVEVHFDGRAVWAAGGGAVGSAEVGVTAEVEVAVEAGTVVCRAPSTADLLAAAHGPDPERALFERCIVASPVEPAALSPQARAAVEAALADADPGADMELSLSCPTCLAAWSAPFDLAAFVWAEVEHAARCTLAEVDVLARAYGWREPDVLALSPWRRRRYLELARG
jgi:hypothetical protein